MDADIPALDVRFRSSGWWSQLALPVLLAVAVGAGWHWQVFPTLFAVVCGSVLVGMLAVLVATAVWASRRSPLARLDVDGLTVADRPLVPWADLVAAEVLPLRSTQVVGRPKLVVALSRDPA